MIRAIIIAWLSFASVATAAELDEEFVAKWGDKRHELVQLKFGQTHYELSGPPDGDLAVLVHGVSGPMTAWDKNINFLNENRVQTLRYDLYGRGFSDRLKTDYALDLFVAQLRNLVDAITPDRKFYLVASSFGCVVAAEFANRFPTRVRGLVLIGPAGFPIEVPFLASLRDVPLLGDFLFWLAGESTIIEQNRKYFVDEGAWEQHKEYYTDQLRQPGSAKAILSTMRNSPVQSYVEGYDRLDDTHIKTTVIWGRNDATFPYENAEVLRGVMPDIMLHTIENSAHLPQFERPDEVNPLLLQALQQ